MKIGIRFHDRDFTFTLYGCLQMLNGYFLTAQNYRNPTRENDYENGYFLSLDEFPKDNSDYYDGIYSRKRYFVNIINSLMPISYELFQNHSKLFIINNTIDDYMRITERDVFFDDEVLYNPDFLDLEGHNFYTRVLLDTDLNYTNTPPVSILS